MDWNAIINLTLKIIAVIALVLLNGFFVAAEFALVKIRDTQLSPLIRRGHRRAASCSPAKPDLRSMPPAKL